MELDRRRLLTIAQCAAVAGFAPLSAEATSASAPPMSPPTGCGGRVALPDRTSFVFDGVHMNAAYTHMTSLRTSAAARAYAESRMRDPGRNWPTKNARDQAAALYAAMINAAPEEIAVVPSTLEGENLIGSALDLGPQAGVVTDAFHYDASLVRYGELARRGMPLTVIAPRENHIDYAELDAAITPRTSLVAVSLVSSATGYKHDLKRICEIAHAKGVYVYADIIQAVGGIPFDVKASGVDFCCAGSYKWLMGEFGAAFLYVRGDRLQDMHRVQLGWCAMKAYQSHALPGDPPGPAVGDWTLANDTASVFEVSTANWGGLAATAASLDYIGEIGVARIDAHRRPMLERLQTELPHAGFVALTPRDAQGPTVVFAQQGVRARVGEALRAANIHVSLYKDRVRISPTVYNDMSEVERLIAILREKA